VATNRTISESKADLKAAADALPAIFRTTFDREPTEIGEEDLNLFSTLDGIDTDEIQEIDPHEECYDVRYDFNIVMVLDRDCLESEVVTVRNTYFSKLFALTKAAKTYPWRIEDMRHYTSHWGHVEGWFITATLSRFTVEDFSS